MNFAPEDFARAGFAIDPFKALIVPRPIAWVSTLGGDGRANLAPYSFFNAFSTEPYYLVFGSGGRKHSLVNAEKSGEFVVNIVNAELAEPMNVSSAHVPVDEFALAGLAKAACVKVKAPRVADAPASFECRLHDIVGLPGEDGQARDFLVIGKVVWVHVDSRFVANGRVDTAAMQPIARLGYSEYATVTEAWRMRRPD